MSMHVCCCDAENVSRHVLHCCALQDGAWRVGEGVCCLTTPTHTYIARVKPSSGDLVMLFSIPQPQPGTQQQAVPVAAWLPHSRYAGPLVHQAVCKDSPGAVSQQAACIHPTCHPTQSWGESQSCIEQNQGMLLQRGLSFMLLAAALDGPVIVPPSRPHALAGRRRVATVECLATP